MGPKNWFEKLPEQLAENRGRNNFFYIPFILGMVGIFYQSVKNTRNFVAVALLFVLTGVALVVYLKLTSYRATRTRLYLRRFILRILLVDRHGRDSHCRCPEPYYP